MRISDWSSDVCSSDLFIERQKLGFDLIKLHWTPQLRQQIEGTDGDKLRDAVAAANPRRIILMRCESDDAIEIGSANGISLFQGYFIDHLLAEKIPREEAAGRLGAATGRHDRSDATPQPQHGPRKHSTHQALDGTGGVRRGN